MSWILIVFLAQFLGALVVLGDKFLISDGQLKSPAVYAFYVSLLSGVVLFMLPFGVIVVPSTYVLILSLLVAISYIVSIMGLYASLKEASAVEVMPVIGGITALSTFVLKHFFYGEVFPNNFLIGSAFLVLGMLLVSHFRFPRKVISYMVVSGILFAVSSVLVKDVFMHTDFMNGFFWTRMANVLGALLLLLIPGNLYLIFHGSKKSNSRTTFLLLINKVVGALSFVLILYAIKIGNVSVVNALSALQFLFLFIIALMFTKQFPNWFGKEVNHHEVLHKLGAISLILAGFLILFI